MNDALVSIVTGVYNSTRYLPHYFRMLEAQTYRNWEAILVDDGSKDDTCTIIEAQCLKDPRFRLLRKTPEGYPSRTRAVGLAHAIGQYIAFVDHDDFWAPQKLSIQLAVLTDHPDASIVHTDRIVWNKVEGPGEYYHYNGDIRTAPVIKQRPEDVIYQGLQIIFSSFIGPEKMIREVGFHPEMKGVDDFYLFVRLAQMGKIYQVALPLTYYYAHANNLSHENNIFVNGFYKVYEVLENDAVPEKAKRSILAQACRTEAVSLFASDRPKALRLLLKSLKLYFIPSTLNRLVFLLATFFIPLGLQKKLFHWVKVVKFKIPTLKDLWSK